MNGLKLLYNGSPLFSPWQLMESSTRQGRGRGKEIKRRGESVKKSILFAIRRQTSFFHPSSSLRLAAAVAGFILAKVAGSFFPRRRFLSFCCARKKRAGGAKFWVFFSSFAFLFSANEKGTCQGIRPRLTGSGNCKDHPFFFSFSFTPTYVQQ